MRISPKWVPMVAVILATAACGDQGGNSVVGPSADLEPATLGLSAVQALGSIPLMDGVCIDPCPTGTAELMHLPNGTLHWKLNASGLTPGHSYTVWLVNGADPFGLPAGHAAGGLVGGSGRIIAAGNQCVSPLNDDFSGGFVPGEGKNCDLIDEEGQITIVLIDHDPWTPGDMAGRWTALGGGFSSFVFATFPAN